MNLQSRIKESRQEEKSPSFMSFYEGCHQNMWPKFKVDLLITNYVDLPGVFLHLNNYTLISVII